MRRFLLALLALAVSSPAARAEFLNPDFSSLAIESVAPPDWVAGPRDGSYIGMCVACEGSVLLEVRVADDDGTGERVRTGETTAETYTALGEANAQTLGGDAAYLGTEPIDFASAVGFKTAAKTASGDHAVSYQLWSDGKQLIVRVYGPDQEMVDSLAENAYRAAAPLTFR